MSANCMRSDQLGQKIVQLATVHLVAGAFFLENVGLQGAVAGGEISFVRVGLALSGGALAPAGVAAAGCRPAKAIRQFGFAPVESSRELGPIMMFAENILNAGQCLQDFAFVG